MIWQTLDYNLIKPVKLVQVWRYSRTVKVLILIAIFSIPTTVLVYYFLFNEAKIWLRSELIQYLAYITFGVFIGIPFGVFAYLRGTYNTIFIKQMNQFAAANNPYYLDFTYQESTYSEGMLFYGSPPEAMKTCEFSGELGLPFTLGNYRLVHKQLGYIRFVLPRRLPNMVLDAKLNNMLLKSTMPSTVQGNQTLSLEGDFNKYYTLYVPKQYEADALYVFTPDVMELLIKTGARYDIEIIDNVLYVYNNKPFEFDSVQAMQDVTWLVEALGEKFARRVDGYRDVTVGDKSVNEIAYQGKMLYRRSGFLQTFTQLSPKNMNKFIVAGICTVLFIGIIVYAAVATLIDIFIGR